MTYYRQIYTKIWTDEWFLELDSNAKLLFIYLFSNSHAGVSGLYKLSSKVIAFETGLDKQYILDTLQEFQEGEKAWYDDSVLWVKKQQVYNATRSPTMQKAIQKEIDLIPDCAVKRLYCNYYLQNDTVDKPSTSGTDRVLKEREREREKERGSPSASGETITPEMEAAGLTIEALASVPGGGKVYIGNRVFQNGIEITKE